MTDRIKGKQEELSDEALYQAWCAGDTHAAALLLQRYQSETLLFAYSFCKNTSSAKDLTQNIFIKICKKAGVQYEIKNFRSFFTTMRYRTCVDYYRKQKNVKETNFPPNEMPEQRSSNWQERLEKKEELERAKRFILSLPPLQKEAYELYVFEEMSLEEIANHIGTSIDSVRGRIDRAKKRMRNLRAKQQKFEK